MANPSIPIYEALQKASLFLDQYGFERHLAQTYFLRWKDWTLTELVLHLNDPLPLTEWARFEHLLERIVNNEPIDYILGYSYFMNRKFKVTKDTLIPREETSGLIELVTPYLIQYPSARVLDIGTGTGIIPITLKLLFPDIQMVATDISQAALNVAIENSQNYQTTIEWIRSDVWQEVPKQTFDVIISNPPYIARSERDVMDASVLLYEPELALFANNQGLEIFERIASQLPHYLSANALAVFEIGYRQGESVSELFQHYLPEAVVSTHKDFNNLDRYILINNEREEN